MRTERSPRGEATLPKPMGGSDLWASPRWKIKSSRQRSSRCCNAVYEVDFLGFSYGCRPGRNPHDALDALAVGLERSKVNWVLNIDIRGFFDAMVHGWLVRFIEHRIADRRIVRLIQKWLKAGVLEDGKHMASEVGSPQGASFSPLAANIYLHYVFDLWAHRWRQRHVPGRCSPCQVCR